MRWDPFAFLRNLFSLYFGNAILPFFTISNILWNHLSFDALLLTFLLLTHPPWKCEHLSLPIPLANCKQWRGVLRKNNTLAWVGCLSFGRAASFDGLCSVLHMISLAINSLAVGRKPKIPTPLVLIGYALSLLVPLENRRNLPGERAGIREFFAVKARHLFVASRHSFLLLPS